MKPAAQRVSARLQAKDPEQADGFVLLFGNQNISLQTTDKDKVSFYFSADRGPQNQTGGKTAQKARSVCEETRLPVQCPSNNVAAIPWMDLRLRPFPSIALKVMRLSEREDVHMGRLAGLIESDPAFSTEVLTVANGWMYACREPIASAQQAVSVLGTRRLQGLCLTVGVRTFLGKSLQMPITRALWRHSVATALIAEVLARHSQIDPDIAYTAGVLHDIGRLGLLVAWPRAYAALLDSHYGSPASILEPETALFGADHCVLSNLLIGDWELPSALFAGHHHRPRLQEWSLPELIKMSCRLADVAGMTAFPGCFIGEYATLLDDLPETCRKHFPPAVESHRNNVNSKLEALEAD